jgi:amino acid transporter
MSSDSGPPNHQPQLGLWDAVSIILGIIIGAGIYETPPQIFQMMPNATMAYSIWGMCGILALIGALCYAELATTYPRDGGDYVYLTRAYHPIIGYLFGWTQLAVIQTGSIGLMAYIFADYATRAVHESALWPDYEQSTMGYAAAAIILITGLNLVGVRMGRSVQNALTVAKIVGLGLIVTAAVAFAHRGQLGGHEVIVGMLRDIPKDESRVDLMADAGYGEFDEEGEEHREFSFAVKEGEGGTRLLIDFQNTTRVDGKSVPVALEHFARKRHVVVEYDKNDPEHTALLIRTVKTDMHLIELMFAMVLVFLTYGGWNDAAFVAAEVRDPSYNIPRALIVGTLGVMGIYLLINWAYIRALGWETAQNSRAIAADVLNLLPGGFGQPLMCVLVMISALGAINGLIFTSSRIYSTMGADYSFFAGLARRQRGTGTPMLSLFIQMVICLAMVFGVGLLDYHKSGFVTLLQCTAPIFWIFFLLTAIGLVVLRVRDPHRPRPFPVPAFPVLPLIFIATCGYMVYSGIQYASFLGWAAWAGPALVFAGLPFYFLSRRTPHPEPNAAAPVLEDELETGIMSGEPPA